MKLFKRILAIFIVFTIIMSTVPQVMDLMTQKAKAATSGNLNVNIANNGLTSNSVTLTWQQVTGAVSYDLKYYDTNKGSQVTTTINSSVSDAVYQITNLSTDFVYNFVVTAKKGDGSTISNNKQVITGISMDVSAVTEAPVPMNGGGLQVGFDPQLKFRIKIPDTYNGASVSEYAFNKVDYDINMGNNVGGSDLDRIKVRYSSTKNQYIATTYINNQVMTVASKVYTDELEPGYMNFYIRGQNANSPTDITPLQNVPGYAGAESGFDASNISEDITQTTKSINLDQIMRDMEITPSMAIRMSILPKIHDPSDTNTAAYLPTAVSGGYTSTPIMFQMNKDSSNNMIATIYRVNQGTSFTYELDASPAIDFPPPVPPQTSNMIASRSDKDAGTSPTLRIYVEKQSSNSTYYFKVLAYDSSGDTLISSPIGYAPNQDVPLAPLPEGLKVLSVTQTTGSVKDTFYTVSNAVYNVKSADVKLIWNKPSNYSDLYAKMSNPASVEDTVYYHVMISSFPDGGNIGDKESFSDMFGDVMNPAKEYNVTNVVYKGYREVYKIDLTACDVVDASGNPTVGGGYLSFTIKGVSLFSKATGFANPVPAIPAQPPKKITQDLTMNTDNYPTYLLPNRIYYTKMYTTKGTAPQSDNSLAVSFTTPRDGQKTPPAPNNFKLIDNKMLADSSNVMHNNVKLEWNKINFNLSDYTANTSVAYSVYYELYINNSMDTNSFLPVGLGEQTTGQTSGDAEFTGLQNISTVVDATVSQFTSSELVNKFGGQLNPNTTYYFAVKTMVSIGGEIQSSAGFSQILSVTTTKGDIVPPNTGNTIPKAPQDFSVAVDASGNKIINSVSATLTWKKLEPDVKYILIQTATKIDSGVTLASLDAQSIPYTALLASPGMDEADQDGVKFFYDPIKNQFTYKVTDLMPNSVYYFSLMAVRTDAATSTSTDSIWISVPVTTSLIGAPDLLSVVADYEAGINWTASGNDAAFTADNFIIKYYENGSSTAVVVPRGQVFISKEDTGSGTSRYFARIVGLKKNSSYTIEVYAHRNDAVLGDITYGPTDFSTSSTPDTGYPLNLTTRESMHEIDVKWKGLDGGNFQIAIKGENDVDYTLLSEGASEFAYISIEKPVDLVGTSYSMYYARIRTTDGSAKLKANSKYYIKVRSVKDNSVTGVQDQSKYIGPVNTRTEFSQSDYDDNDESNKEDANYADMVKKYKDSIFWEMGYDSGIYKIKLRRDKAENLINHSSNAPFILDLTATKRTDAISERIIYIPLTTLQLLTTKGENLVVRIPGAEFVYKPGTIDLDNSSLITDMVNNASVKETYIYLDINKLSDPSGDLPANATKACDIESFAVQVKGTYVSDADIEASINTELNTLIAAGLKSLHNVDPSLKTTSQLLNDQINSIVTSFDSTLKNYIRDYIEGNSSTGYSTQIADYTDITAFTKPLSVKMSYLTTLKGSKSGYVFDGSDWLAKTSFMSSSNGTVTFDTMITGDYVILATSAQGIFNIPDGHWAAKDIDAFTSKYDLRDIFQAEYYANIDSPITINDTVLVIAKVLSAEGKSSSSNALTSKAKELGLDGTANFSTPSRNITRQELAALLMRVYKIKTGADPTNMKASKTIIINDDSSISKSHYKEVEISIDLKILTLDDKQNFKPNDSCSKAQMISSITRLLRLVGEM